MTIISIVMTIISVVVMTFSYLEMTSVRCSEGVGMGEGLALCSLFGLGMVGKNKGQHPEDTSL